MVPWAIKGLRALFYISFILYSAKKNPNWNDENLHQYKMMQYEINH